LLGVDHYFLIGIGKRAILPRRAFAMMQVSSVTHLKFRTGFDDQQSMIDRILNIASLAFRAIQHLIEQPEQRRQYNRLARWQEFVPAPVKARQPVRIVDTGRR
jgi:hypothetical protein